ncbi:hypothetical protein NDU88_006367 [Pleurodeles waltl]|uniref:Uncharacterized protein n=1 Tax=Pleurodeles waltl TaxID=8319 RepID=A0AAV7VR72_PLEWA|nr:hypothetical protein NDU88_006367 [Pleurodeles waltl]
MIQATDRYSCGTRHTPHIQALAYKPAICAPCGNSRLVLLSQTQGPLDVWVTPLHGTPSPNTRCNPSRMGGRGELSAAKAPIRSPQRVRHSMVAAHGRRLPTWPALSTPLSWCEPAPRYGIPDAPRATRSHDTGTRHRHPDHPCKLFRLQSPCGPSFCSRPPPPGTPGAGTLARKAQPSAGLNPFSGPGFPRQKPHNSKAAGQYAKPQETCAVRLYSTAVTIFTG